jgi:hypothetical protein
MIIDPVTAFGLAVNVLQLLEFGGQLIAKSRELHSSSDGYMVEHREILTASRRLYSLQLELTDSLQLISKKSTGKAHGLLILQTGPDKLTHAEQALKAVLEECEGIAQDFSQALEKFAASPGQHKWKSYRSAFKALWNKDGLLAMQRRLSQQREQLVIHLLVIVQ